MMNRPGMWGLGGLAMALALTAVYLGFPDARPSGAAQGVLLPAPIVVHAADEGSLRTGKKPASGEPASATSPSPDARQKLQSLLRQFNDTRSYRQFVASALKDARHGGLVYALAATGACDTFRAARRSNKPTTPSNQAQHSAALLEARCDITGDETLDQLSTAMQTHAVELNSDPLFAMLVPGAAGKSRDESLRRARALMNSGDPIAMGSLVQLDYRDSLGEIPYFDGRQYRSPADRDRMADAWLLVECDLGVSCGADATQTLLLCATRDWCGSSLAEAMEIGRAADGSFTDVRALADALLREIRAKRAEAFVPKA